jgi:hypothetical protein
MTKRPFPSTTNSKNKKKKEGTAAPTRTAAPTTISRDASSGGNFTLLFTFI